MNLYLLIGQMNNIIPVKSPELMRFYKSKPKRIIKLMGYKK